MSLHAWRRFKQTPGGLHQFLDLRPRGRSGGRIGEDLDSWSDRVADESLLSMLSGQRRLPRSPGSFLALSGRNPLQLGIGQPRNPLADLIKPHSLIPQPRDHFKTNEVSPTVS